MELLDTNELAQVVGGVSAIELIDLAEGVNRYQQLMQAFREPYANSRLDQ